MHECHKPAQNHKAVYGRNADTFSTAASLRWAASCQFHNNNWRQQLKYSGFRSWTKFLRLPNRMFLFDSPLKHYLWVIDHGMINHWKAITIDRYTVSFEFVWVCARVIVHTPTQKPISTWECDNNFWNAITRHNCMIKCDKNAMGFSLQCTPAPEFIAWKLLSIKLKG